MGLKKNPNDSLYQEPVLVEGAQIGPRLVSATETLPAFYIGEARELITALSVHKYLTTALAGTNNDITFFAKRSGDQDITITYTDPGGVSASFAVEVVDGDIEITLARAASAIVTKASDVIAGIEASTAASALVSAIPADGNDGTGVVTALTETSLGGPAGTNPTLDVEFKASIGGINFYSINAHFAQKTDVAETEGGNFVNLATWGQYTLTLGGTNSVFAISIETAYKP